MSYPATQLRQEIGRRLGGRCRVDLLGGKALTFGGDRLGDHTSCADCSEDCGRINATGVHQGVLTIEVDGRGDETRLRWACPSCGHPVIEATTPLEAASDARMIEGDPLCHACRKAQQR